MKTALRINPIYPPASLDASPQTRDVSKLFVTSNFKSSKLRDFHFCEPLQCVNSGVVIIDPVCL